MDSLLVKIFSIFKDQFTYKFSLKIFNLYALYAEFYSWRLKLINIDIILVIIFTIFKDQFAYEFPLKILIHMQNFI